MSSSKRITLDREVITPAQAKRYLEANTINRNLREPQVKKLVGAIKRGEWVETGDPIKFDTNGDLPDGQHRLHAIARAGKKVVCWVARNVPVEAQEVVDTGSARTFGDMLKLRGYKSAAELATAARAIWNYRQNGLVSSQNQPIPPTNQQLMSVVKDNPTLPDFIGKSRRFRHRDPALKVPGGMLTAIWFIFTEKVDETDADGFFAEVLNPPSQGSPTALLRKRLLQATPHRPISPMVKAAFLIKSWNAYINGERPKQLTWKPGGKVKEPFPQVEGYDTLDGKTRKIAPVPAEVIEEIEAA